jgi:hypothetical protein
MRVTGYSCVDSFVTPSSPTAPDDSLTEVPEGLSEDEMADVVTVAVEGFMAGLLERGDGQDVPSSGTDWSNDPSFGQVGGNDGSFDPGFNDPSQPPLTDSTGAEAYDPTRGPQDGDVSQGTANDCWVLATLDAVARSNPQVLKKGLQANGDGTYGVTLYDPSGKPQTFQVSPPGPNSAYPLGGTLAGTPKGLDGLPHDWVSLYENYFIKYAQQ